MNDEPRHRCPRCHCAHLETLDVEHRRGAERRKVRCRHCRNTFTVTTDAGSPVRGVPHVDVRSVRE